MAILSNLITLIKHLLIHDSKKNDLICAKCGEKFASLSELQLHVIKHKSQEKHTCRHCEQEFSTRDAWYKHVIGRQCEKPYDFKCEQCGKGFWDNHCYTRHMVTHSDKKPFVCPQCGKGFGTSTSMHRHLSRHKGEKPHACEECGKRFQGLGDLKVHIMIHTGEKPCACPQFGRRFSRKSELNRHIRCVHTDERPHACPQCDRTFAVASKARRHIKTHSRLESYPCTQCGKRFKKEGDLINHLRWNHASHYEQYMTTHDVKKRNYACHHCRKEFPILSSLKSHMLTHSGDKPHACPHCDTRFARSSYLKSHILTHTGERPHVCSYCGKGFAKPFYLTVHIRTHTGEKPYVCPHCSRGFANHRNLNLHIRTHTREKPYVRSHCSKSFSQAQHLKEHSKRHTQKTYSQQQPTKSSAVKEPAECECAVIPGSCRDCINGFLTVLNLQSHMKVLHGGITVYRTCYFCVRGFIKEKDMEVHLITNGVKCVKMAPC